MFIETESKIVISRAGGRATLGLPVQWCRVSVLRDDRIPETDDSDDCTTT